MKKMNKGFSLVELIIVIAIMAILAGALAPALIKYINKSRISTDIQTGQSIATAIQTALSNEKAFDDAKADTKGSEYSAFVTAQGANMQKELNAIMGAATNVKGKAKKDFKGNALNQNFYVKCDPTSNVVEVYLNSANAATMVYPTVGANLVE